MKEERKAQRVREMIAHNPNLSSRDKHRVLGNTGEAMDGIDPPPANNQPVASSDDGNKNPDNNNYNASFNVLTPQYTATIPNQTMETTGSTNGTTYIVDVPPPQASGMQQMPLQASGMQQMPPQALGIQQMPPQASGIQQMPPQASGMQQIPPQALGMQQMLPQALGIQQMLPQASGMQQMQPRAPHPPQQGQNRLQENLNASLHKGLMTRSEYSSIHEVVGRVKVFHVENS